MQQIPFLWHWFEEKVERVSKLPAPGLERFLSVVQERVEEGLKKELL
ncbi:MAG: hypothetical protein WC081_01255 [Candidatus Ratteibacteria bacterium]